MALNWQDGLHKIVLPHHSFFKLKPAGKSSFSLCTVGSWQTFVGDPHFQDFLLAAKLGGNASNQKGERGRDTGTPLCVTVCVYVCVLVG